MGIPSNAETVHAKHLQGDVSVWFLWLICLSIFLPWCVSCLLHPGIWPFVLVLMLSSLLQVCYQYHPIIFFSGWHSECFSSNIHFVSLIYKMSTTLTPHWQSIFLYFCCSINSHHLSASHNCIINMTCLFCHLPCLVIASHVAFYRKGNFLQESFLGWFHWYDTYIIGKKELLLNFFHQNDIVKL